MATALPFIMGQGLSPAASHARLALFLNAGAWICMLASSLWYGQTPDLHSFHHCHGLDLRQPVDGVPRAENWLGPRPLRGLLRLLVWIMPLGYALSFSSYQVRVGWANLVLAAQMLIVGARLPLPTAESSAAAPALPAVRLPGGDGGPSPRRAACWRVVHASLYPSPCPYAVNIAALIGANMSLVLGHELPSSAPGARRPSANCTAGQYRHADRPAQPPRLDDADDATRCRQAQRHGHPPVTADGWTWTTSNASTTRTATRLATRRCSSWQLLQRCPGARAT